MQHELDIYNIPNLFMLVCITHILFPRATNVDELTAQRGSLTSGSGRYSLKMFIIVLLKLFPCLIAGRHGHKGPYYSLVDEYIKVINYI